MKVRTLFNLITTLSFSSLAYGQVEAVRQVPAFVSTDSFADQFNQLDFINFWVYNSQGKGWREAYLNPFQGAAKADAQSVWGNFYFPFTAGGMATRWQALGNEPRSPTLKELKWKKVIALPPDQINKLSPCEKADLYYGNQDFRITKHEMYWRGILRGQQASAGVITSTAGNEGFCNGARAAGALVPEPIKDVTLISLAEPKLKITFSPLDIKMLATISYFSVNEKAYSMIGLVTPESADIKVNAAVLDAALRSIIGTKQMAFFMDSDPQPGVPNNVTIVGYERQTAPGEPLSDVEKQKYPNAFNKIKVNTKLFYLGEVMPDDAKQPTSQLIKDHSRFITKAVCEYYLYLENNTNNILDGAWIANSFVPDNLWFASGYGNDDAYTYNNIITTWDDKIAPRLGNPYLSGIFVHHLVNQSK